MTTIAFDGKTLAADGRMADAAIIDDSFVKIFRVKGTMVGISGEASKALSLKDWLSASKGEMPDADGTELLVIQPDGSAYYIEGGGHPVPACIPCAIGSGRDFALAAMDAGADAEAAVRAAMKRDPYTGGQIRTLKLIRRKA
jgi:20S proteasome alpha/beta subunit